MNKERNDRVNAERKSLKLAFSFPIYGVFNPFIFFGKRKNKNSLNSVKNFSVINYFFALNSFIKHLSIMQIKSNSTKRNSMTNQFVNLKSGAINFTLIFTRTFNG